MASDKSEKMLGTTTVKDGKGKIVNAFPASPPPAKGPGGKINFEMYCEANHIPVQRRAGMKVFARHLKFATPKEWDEAFRRY